LLSHHNVLIAYAGGYSGFSPHAKCVRVSNKQNFIGSNVNFLLIPLATLLSQLALQPSRSVYSFC